MSLSSGGLNIITPDSSPLATAATTTAATPAPVVPPRRHKHLSPSLDTSSRGSVVTFSSTSTQQQQQHQHQHHSRHIYPALLSEVALAFREQITVGTHAKDGLNYSTCFLGREAVDTLAMILRSPDRHLALLVGRALNAQRFFEDVTYCTRLRDSPHELYQFQDRLSSIVDGTRAASDSASSVVKSLARADAAAVSTLERYHQHIHHKRQGTAPDAPMSPTTDDDLNRTSLFDPEDAVVDELPTGVFTFLLKCYLARLPSQQTPLDRLMRNESALSIGTTDSAGARGSSNNADDDSRYWHTTAPAEIVDAVSADEVKRQEAIFELITSEEQYVDDLFLVEKLFMKPLVAQQLLSTPQASREFVQLVFSNILQIRDIHRRISNKLLARQNQKWVVDQVGDVLLEFLQLLEKPYVQYGEQQPWGKYHLEMEVAVNPNLAQFLAEAERRPEARRLPIQSFLNRPTTRLARYPLLLEAIMKRTPPDHPDQAGLQTAVDCIKRILGAINQVAGKADNRVRLTTLNDHLVFKGTEEQTLSLLDPGRRLLRDGLFKRKTTQSTEQIHVFLTDSCLLFTKKKKTKYSYEYKIWKRAIPLELLVVSNPDDGRSQQSRSIATSKRALRDLHTPILPPYSNHQHSLSSPDINRLLLEEEPTVAAVTQSPVPQDQSLQNSKSPLFMSAPDLRTSSKPVRSFTSPARGGNGIILPHLQSKSSIISLNSSLGSTSTMGSGSVSHSNPGTINSVGSAAPSKQSDFAIMFTHLGRHGDSGGFTLYASSDADRVQWIDTILDRQRDLADETHVFDIDLVHPNPTPVLWAAHSVTATPTMSPPSPGASSSLPPSPSTSSPSPSFSFRAGSKSSQSDLSNWQAAASLAAEAFKERVNACVTLPDGRLVLATDNGVYVEPTVPAMPTTLSESTTLQRKASHGELLHHADQKPRRTGARHFVQVIALDKVAQIEVLREFEFILVLADKILYSYPYEVLDVVLSATEMSAEAGPRSRTNTASVDYPVPVLFGMDKSTLVHTRRASSDHLRRAAKQQQLTTHKGRKVSSAVLLVRVGLCLERTLVCVVKSSTLSTTIKVYEPALPTKKSSGFSRFLKGHAELDGLRLFKELYVPVEATSLHFMRTKLCIGTAKGFEVIDIETLQTQSMLNHEDPTLAFALADNVRPIAMFRLTNMFLLCYADFGIYIGRNGWRGRDNFIVRWQGEPRSFSYCKPYILAFNPQFIEIYHGDSGALVQIIPAHQLVCLEPGTAEPHCAMWISPSVLSSYSAMGGGALAPSATTELIQVLVKLVARKQ
ncbi:RHO1 GDP-GTP exchange protein 2 [Sorochytrium milnesiophthora]